MSRSSECFGGSGGMSKDSACEGSIMCRYASCNKYTRGIDGLGIGGQIGVFVVGDHLWEI